MEMPEGWNRLMHQTEEMREGARLLKEMAEALGKALEFEDCQIDCEIYGHKEMRWALQKFKDWK